jgi:gas vesicle protein
MFKTFDIKEVIMSAKDQVSSFFIGFLTGGLIGATAVLLLAPQSGEETRTQIRDKGIEFKEKTEATYAQLEKQLETTAAELRAEMDRLATRVEEVIVQGKETLAQRLTALGEQISPEKEPPVVEKTTTEA